MMRMIFEDDKVLPILQEDNNRTIRDTFRVYFNFESWLSELRGNNITTEQYNKLNKIADIARED